MAVYDRYVTTHYDEFLPTLRPVGPQGWGSVAPLGLWSYALWRRRQGAGRERHQAGDVSRRPTRSWSGRRRTAIA